MADFFEGEENKMNSTHSSQNQGFAGSGSGFGGSQPQQQQQQADEAAGFGGSGGFGEQQGDAGFGDGGFGNSDGFGSQQQQASTTNEAAFGGSGGAFGGSQQQQQQQQDEGFGFATEQPAKAPSPAASKSASHEDPFGAPQPAAAASTTSQPAVRSAGASVEVASKSASQAQPGKVTVPTVEESTRDAEKRVMERGKPKADAEAKVIDERTKAVDQKNNDGVSTMRKTAQQFLSEEAAKRQKHLATAKQAHRQEQKAHEDRVASLQRGGHLWEQVAEVVDTTKNNKYAHKSTDRMRNLLVHLKTTPNSKQISAAA